MGGINMSSLEAGDVRLAALQSNQPIVLRGFVRDWELCSRSLETWSTDFGDSKVSWRVAKRARLSDEPCWERTCERRDFTFKEFLAASENSKDWMYFDYKHLNEWFPSENDIVKKTSWSKFGFAEKGGADSTLWVGSRGAHTPAHRDTYGCNMVAQLHGEKRWMLFPPEAAGLRATRVPYEESSIYSELNFCCPRDLDPFKGVSGGRSVVLSAGDALLVPRGWWHHVQHVSHVAITLNVWLPHESDAGSRVSEALVRILVAQLCKDLPPETTRLLLNPNEDDLADTPLAVLFLQLDTVLQSHLDERRKLRRLKRQKTTDREQNDSAPPEFDLNKFLEHEQVELVPTVAPEELIGLLKDNVKSLADMEIDDEDEVDGTTSKLRLTKAVIDAYCQSDVVDLVKKNLLSALS